MLLIHNAQLQYLTAGLERELAGKCLANLKKKFPDCWQKLDIPQGQEEKTIMAALKDARSYGLIFEEDFLLYTECMVLLGIHFDKKGKEPEWPYRILTNDMLSGESKMNALLEHLLFSPAN